MCTAMASAASIRTSVVAPGRLAARGCFQPCIRGPKAARRYATTVHATAAVQQEEQVWRPSLDDVQRISFGDAARHRGTGSRAVPHRLNAEERKQYDIAKQKGVLTLAGSGYRRERKGSPLANIWRQLCDARGQPCVLLAKGATAAAGDTVLVDLSVLRLRDVSQYQEACRAIAARYGLTRQPDSALFSPFTVILPSKLANALLQAAASSSSSSPADSSTGAPAPDSSSSSEEEEGEAPSAADAAADGKETEQAGTAAEQPTKSVSSSSGSDDGNLGSDSDPLPSTAAAPAAAPEEDSIEAQLAELRASAPIWQHPPQLEGFVADRATAKALAKQLADELRKLGPVA